MPTTNPFMKSIRESVGMRIAVLFGSFFILLLFSSFIGSIINAISLGSERDHILISSAIQCVLAFCLPAIILSKFSSNKWEKWLKLTKAPSLKSFLGVIIVYFLSMPAMEWLIEWNSNLHLPASLSSIEEVLRGWEEASESMTNTILEAHGIFPVLIGILVIGVLTGFSEELFFRGGLQGIFSRSNLGNGLAVWLAAIIFSCMHFQFFGFFPRLLMGVFFGYLLIWTRSIWVPVFAHALNNSMVVISSSFTESPMKNLSDYGNASILFDNSLSVVGSVALTAIFLILFRNYIFKNNKHGSYKWQRSQLPPVSGR